MFKAIFLLFQIIVIVSYSRAADKRITFQAGKVVTINNHEYRILKNIHLGDNTAVYSVIHIKEEVSYKN